MKLYISLLGILFSCYSFCQDYHLSDEIIENIAFGSCNDQKKGQHMWKDILAQNPEAWIWLGDIVYASDLDLEQTQMAYTKQKSNPDYQKLIKSSEILGIWDDHDYGLNDGGKEYAYRKESKNLLFDFLDIPRNHPAWNRASAYHSFSIGPAGKQIVFIFLDTRYFRDELVKNPNPKIRYFPNKNGDILGEAQWKWLEKQLAESKADVHIIASGIQVLAEDHGYEKWSNFPSSKKKLFDLFDKYEPSNMIIISGDRHIAEISKTEYGQMCDPIIDITSSGLTHSYEKADEENRHRISPLIGQKNFGMIKIDWAKGPLFEIELRGLNDTLFHSMKF